MARRARGTTEPDEVGRGAGTRGESRERLGGRHAGRESVVPRLGGEMASATGFLKRTAHVMDGFRLYIDRAYRVSDPYKQNTRRDVPSPIGRLFGIFFESIHES